MNFEKDCVKVLTYRYEQTVDIWKYLTAKKSENTETTTPNDSPAKAIGVYKRKCKRFHTIVSENMEIIFNLQSKKRNVDLCVVHPCNYLAMLVL